MPILTFNYTKKANDVTSRVYVPLVSPGVKNYFGIDITELSEEDQGIFAAKVKAIQDDSFEAISKVMKEYDIEHMFRSFKPENMSDIETEQI